GGGVEVRAEAGGGAQRRTGPDLLVEAHLPAVEVEGMGGLPGAGHRVGDLEDGGRGPGRPAVVGQAHPPEQREDAHPHADGLGPQRRHLGVVADRPPGPHRRRPPGRVQLVRPRREPQVTHRRPPPSGCAGAWFSGFRGVWHPSLPSREWLISVSTGRWRSSRGQAAAWASSTPSSWHPVARRWGSTTSAGPCPARAATRARPTPRPSRSRTWAAWPWPTPTAWPPPRAARRSWTRRWRP